MDSARLPDGQVAITLTYDEALVLSDLLSRWVDRDHLIDQLPLDQAERVVIWNLQASFEPVIDEVFNDDYDQVVERARASLRYSAE